VRIESTPTMNILHVVGGFDVSGRSRVIHDLCLGLKGRGFVSTVVSLTDSVGYAQDEVPVLSIAKREGFDPSAVMRLREVIISRNASVVHSHGRGALVYASLAARLTRGARLIHTVHRSDGDPVAARPLIRRFILSNVNTVTAVSDVARREFVEANGLPYERTIAIYNGIDPQRYAMAKPDRAPESSGSPVIGTVANLSYDKDTETLLHGFAKIRDTHPDATLVVVGDGPRLRDARVLAAQLGIQDNVDFLGFRTNVQDILPQFDVLAHSATTEGFGLALVEAMAAGVPVVAGRVGGIPEVIEDGVSGLLFEQGNADALNEAVCIVLQDEALRGKLVAAGLKRVKERFSLKRMCEAYEEVYRTALA